MSIREFQARSASTRELVLPFEVTLAALETLEASGARLLGWEGWLRQSNGSLGHSAEHQGTISLGGRDATQAFPLVRQTMRESHLQHLRSPEIPGSELLFCITYEA
jgi:hypothetical protein